MDVLSRMWRVVRWVGRALVVAVVVLVVVFDLFLLKDKLAERSVPVTVSEFAPPGEVGEIQRLVRAATMAVTEDPKLIGDPLIDNPDLIRRDAHSKPHGCVFGHFTVDDTIPDRYRVGVFEEPGKAYEAWIRFSNAVERDDTVDDGRGMAIKLMGVEGEKVLTPEEDIEQGTQDFVMVNYHTFILSELDEYETFFQFQMEEKQFLFFFVPWYRPKALKFRHGVRMLGQTVPSPLVADYFSMSAYKFGRENMKFSAQPCDASLHPGIAAKYSPGLLLTGVWPAFRRASPPMPDGWKDDPNYLREQLVQDLRADSACFHFMIQLQDASKRMPIEDPAVEWSQDDSPYRQVATIRIPPQEFNTLRQNEFCEQLQFSPFHAVKDMRPVGRMNRVRHFVYQQVSRRRHARNEVPIFEPKGRCLRLDGQPCPEDAQTGSTRQP
jgi:hypothetical protein